jgi:hypothetical protein
MSFLGFRALEIACGEALEEGRCWQIFSKVSTLAYCLFKLTMEHTFSRICAEYRALVHVSSRGHHQIHNVAQWTCENAVLPQCCHHGL